MAKAKLILIKNKPDSLGECPVVMKFTHRSLLARVSTNIKVRLPEVSKETPLRLKGQIKTQDDRATRINLKFKELEALAEKMIWDRQMAREEFTALDLANEFTILIDPNRKKAQKGIWDSFEEIFLKHCKIIGNSAGTLKTKKHSLATFRSYLKGAALPFKSITKTFFDDMVDWMLDEKNYEPSYVQKKLRHLKEYLLFCFTEGVKVSKDVLSYKPQRKISIRMNDVIFLTMAELTKLYNFQCRTAADERLRDAFLVMCFSGLRHSDANLDISDIRSDRIVKRMKKTDKNATIPLTGILDAILKKYDSKPPYYANQVINREVKRIAGEAGLNRLVKVIKYPGGIKTIRTAALFEIVSTKFGRRSLVSILLAAGVPEHLIRDITGHARPINMDPYKGVSSEQVFEAVHNVFKLPDN